MISLVVLIVVLVVGLFIYLNEKFNQELFIVKVINDQKVTGKSISKETELVIAQLKDTEKLKLRRYNNLIVLPDGQEISYRHDDLSTFKTTSRLNYEPNSVEWKILIGIIKKLYPTL